MSLARVERSGKAPPTKLTWTTFVRATSKWRWYAFTLGYALYGPSCGASSYFAIWLLKSEGFSVSARNIIPTGTNLISPFCVVLPMMLWHAQRGFLSDFTGNRFAWVIIPLTYGFIPNANLVVWPASTKLEFAFLTGGVQLMTAILYANVICVYGNEERALVVSSMNGFQYAVVWSEPPPDLAVVDFSTGSNMASDRHFPPTHNPLFQ
ncbi:uncharacterized protein BDW43DRAFT_306969 [Aspergillus alliaceus]|uniref:uncharacterized protein n=1 Tax=Petromyces alliaceus TaxID=209559 RepID=UPI0012A4D863|nr:uncharacterized protein BDW43DRAFT_306969 [Aspergillus alliaceus]KAB8238283.1 hypothetical protein BDW43DRAFT_306969 [Aspergillus alliaceus]